MVLSLSAFPRGLVSGSPGRMQRVYSFRGHGCSPRGLSAQEPLVVKGWVVGVFSVCSVHKVFVCFRVDRRSSRSKGPTQKVGPEASIKRKKSPKGEFTNAARSGLRNEKWG